MAAAAVHGPASLTFGELADLVGGSLAQDAMRDTRIVLGPRRVAVHSDLAEPGAVFFALRGKRDGHEWVDAALTNGAACAVVARSVKGAENPRVLRVDDPLAALQALARWYRAQLRCSVIAVAGSVGKTTTKDALVSFLGEGDVCYGSPGSFNSVLGVPLSVLSCPHDASVAVFEIATTEPGTATRMVDIVQPATVIITRIGGRHLKNFRDVAAYANELSALVRYVPAGGIVVCGDDTVSFRDQVPPSVRFLSPSAPAWPIRAVERSGIGEMKILFAVGDATRRIDMPTSSTWLAEDVSLAVAAATLLGAPPRSQSHTPTSLDLQTWRSPSGVRMMRSAAIDDSMAWRAAISDALSEAGESNRVYFALSDEVHTLSPVTLLSLCAAAKPRCSVFVTEGFAAHVLAAAEPAVPLRVFTSAEELGRELTHLAVADDVVAAFAGRGQLIDGVSKMFFEAMAPTRLYIDVGAIELNLVSIRRHCPGARVMAVVKAGAYGVDAPELSRHLVAAGVDEFAVSQTDEGVAIRRYGVGRPILVLLATPDELQKAHRAQLNICLHSPEILNAVLAHSSIVVGVHVEIETGMNRTGLDAEDVVPALKALRDAGITVNGIMTHLAGADDESLDDFTTAQLSVFDRVIEAVRAAGLAVPPRHALASSGLIRFPGHAMEMVRVGLAMLGIAPSPDCRALSLRPSLTLVSRLSDRRLIRRGERVGYGGTFRAPNDLAVGVVQAGYHDGIFRSFAPSGAVFIEGKRCPVIGRVSMDSLTVDLSSCPAADVGSDVVIFGSRGLSSQPIEIAADAMGTIPYEVISRLGPRVQRIFVRR